jgi:DnaJ family protein A protein 2
MNREKACILLNLPIHFNQLLLRKKYKLACLKYHPDKGGNPELFLQVKEAFEYLNEDEDSCAYDILNNFDNNTLYYYVSVLNFFKENIDSVINPVINHLKKFEYYELHPTLDQLFKKSLYVLNEIYVPLWHHELTIKNYKIKIVPDLPDYIDIDANNNIHVYIRLKQLKTFTFDLGGISFLITPEENIFLGRGIPIIQEKIYDISKLSDVIFHISINS